MSVCDACVACRIKLSDRCRYIFRSALPSPVYKCSKCDQRIYTLILGQRVIFVIERIGNAEMIL